MSPVQKIVGLLPFYLLAVALLISNYGFFGQESSGGAVLLSKVPKKIGPWQGSDLNRDKAWEIFSLKDPKGFYPLVRSYSLRGGLSRVILSSLEDLKGFQTEIHDPRVCYESRGWTVLSYEDYPLTTGSGTLGNMKLIVFTNPGAMLKRMELFGYVVGKRVIDSDIQLRLIHVSHRLLRMVRARRSHVIYLSISTDIRGPDPKASLADLTYLARDIIDALIPREGQPRG